MDTEIIVAFGIILCIVAMLLYVIAKLARRNDSLTEALMTAARTLAVYQAAREGDLDTARLMAAVNRDATKTKPPLSAGAKPEEPKLNGVVITQTG
jgi:hypothetical protein